ncbi:MAG: formyltransferase family protein [Parcubacteria group bacterium]
MLRIVRQNGWRTVLEMWYAYLLRREHQVRAALGYFREITPSERLGDSSPFKVLEVESANLGAVHEILRKLSPRLIAVWGGPILGPSILNTAQKSINLHFGLCPYYRGALANQHAVMRGDFSRIGATVLYINSQPDAGEILATISADTDKPPRALFRDLNNRATAKYLEVATNLYLGKKMKATPQAMSESQILLRAAWTPKMRYTLGKQILAWEKQFDKIK